MSNVKVMSSLKRLGYNRFAGGMYGHVCSIPKADDRVMKVCLDPRDGWPTYINWVMTMAPKGSALAPKVHSLSIRPGRTLAIMEKLKPIWSGNVEQGDWAARKFDAVSEYLYFGHVEDYRKKWVSEEDILFLDGLRELRRTHKAHLDLHNENVMIRPNGELVITDPFSGTDAPLKGPSRVRSTAPQQIAMA